MSGKAQRKRRPPAADSKTKTKAGGDTEHRGPPPDPAPPAQATHRERVLWPYRVGQGFFLAILVMLTLIFKDANSQRAHIALMLAFAEWPFTRG